MAKLNVVKACRKAQGICGKCMTEIKVGDGYVWWQFYQGPLMRRCTKPECQPDRKELVSSAFERSRMELEERLAAITEPWDVDDIIADIEALKDECESSLDNMPEGLRESSDSGVLLQERMDALETWAEELGSAKDEAEGGWDGEEGSTESVAEQQAELLQAIKDVCYGG